MSSDAEAFRERPHPLLENLVQVGEGQGGAFLVQLLRNAPRDAPVVGHAEDDSFFSGHESHGSRITRATRVSVKRELRR